jgi:diguanylate cyclase (GGDEF)-like protein
MRTEVVSSRGTVSDGAPARAAQAPMAARRVRALVALAVGFVALVVFFDSSGILPTDAEVVVDNAAQLFAGVTAAAMCLATGRRLAGPERRWRLWMGAGMVGWSVGMAFWSYFQVVADTPLPSPSVADVGFLTLPVLAVPALFALATAPRHAAVPGEQHARTVLLLDGAIVIGSLFVLMWATSLGAVVDAAAPTTSAFVVAVAYPASDWMLVVIVGLLAVLRRVPPHLRPQLWLLAAGLVAFSVSDSIFAYIVANGLDEMPPATNAGFILGPLLVAVAAVDTSDGPSNAAHMHAGADPQVERLHLILPYGLVALTGAVVLAQSLVDSDIDVVEASVAWLVLAFVLVRQGITLLQNQALLRRVSAAQAELAYRAHHDPLTGLANRSLFNERLAEAMARHRDYGNPFALMLVDLDDFKAINDTMGHAAGDQLLMAVGDRLRGCVRGGDTVARLGGDEFAVVLRGGDETPNIVGQRILVALRQPFHIDRRMLSLGASLGVVEAGAAEPGLTPDQLMHRADEAMYAGKRRGKGMTVHYRPGIDRAVPEAPTRPASPWSAPWQADARAR